MKGSATGSPDLMVLHVKKDYFMVVLFFLFERLAWKKALYFIKLHVRVWSLKHTHTRSIGRAIV